MRHFRFLVILLTLLLIFVSCTTYESMKIIQGTPPASSTTAVSSLRETGETPTEIPIPTASPEPLIDTPEPHTSTSEIEATSSGTAARTEFLGLWEYGGERPSLPEPAGEGQVIFAHGDLKNDGLCNIKEFGPGGLVQDLGSGTFKLWLLSGSPQQIEAQKAKIQQDAAKGSLTGECPYLER